MSHRTPLFSRSSLAGAAARAWPAGRPTPWSRARALRHDAASRDRRLQRRRAWRAVHGRAARGSRESIEIVGDDNIVPLIKTSLRSTGARSTLQIELPRDTRVVARVPVVVTIDYVRVEALAIGGTGNISGNALKSAKLEASIGGSGTLRLPQLEVGELAVSMGGSGAFAADGTARSVAISMAGSGRCDTERLAAADVYVSIAGSGDARVRADASLQVSIAGSGELHYAGTATPQVSIVGSGRMQPL